MTRVLALLLFSFQMAQAQTVDRTVTVENPEPPSKLSIAALTEQANRKMAEDLIIEFIGAESYNRNKKALTAKVINRSSRFTPFQKVQDLDRGAHGSRITVQYKISLTDFRKLLMDAGIFSKTRLAPHVLAFFVIEDADGKRRAVSWQPKGGRPEDQALLFDWSADFKKTFEKAGYTYNKNINPEWLAIFSETATVEDFVNKNGVKDSIILFGLGREIGGSGSDGRSFTTQVKVYSQQYKKEVTDSIRRFQSRDESAQKWETWSQDLVAQLDDIDAKSLTQENRIRLTFIGSLTLLEQDSFKQWLLNSTPLIKSVSERRFETQKVQYELESDASPQALATRLGSLKYKDKKFRVQFSSSEIRLEEI